MSLRLSIFLIIISVFTVGCSSMSKKDCQNADWFAYGLQDGRAGAASTKVANYVKTCGKHDIGINQNQYLAGHEQGIRQYCQPNTAYQIGLNGRSMPQVCPSDLQAEFSAAHAKGMTEFKIKRDISAAKKAYQTALSQQNDYEQALIQATAKLYAKSSAANKSAEQAEVDQVNSQIQQAIAAQVVAVGQLACANGDWFLAGETDGLAGRSGSTYKRHVRQCQPYHPAADQRRYIKGQSAGLQSYCSYESGVKLGELGRSTSTLCQGNDARELTRGHQQGLQRYNQKITIAGLKLRKDALQKSAQTLQKDEQSIAQQLENVQLSNAQKLELTRALNRAKYDYDANQQELSQTTTELNCYIGDWTEVGFASAEKGEVFSNPSLQCASFGIATNTQAFEEGYNLGLQRYCTELSGRSLGALGHKYQQVCPQRLEGAFLRGYTPAYERFKRAELSKELTNVLSEDEGRLANITQEIDNLAINLEQDGISRAEKLAIINEMSALSREEKRLSSDTEKTSSHLQCLSDDWFALGKSHGEQGMRSQLLKLNCARFGLQENSNDYRNGYSRGVAGWCVESRGYDDGLNGNTASELCSRSAHPSYYSGFAKGQAEVAKKQQIDTLRLEKLDLIEQQEGLQKQLSALENKLLNSQLSPQKRRELNTDKVRVAAALANIDAQLQTIQFKLDSL